MRTKGLLLPFALLMVCVGAFAADTVMTWPNDGKEPMVRVTVGKMRQVNSAGGQTDYVADATVENVGKKPLPFASFYVYLLDKNKKRVGEGYLEVSNLAAGQQAKVPVTAHVSGSIASMELQPQHLPSDEPTKVKVALATTPTGASIKIDGREAGYTPQMAMLAPGKHTFEFAKEGYQTATKDVEIATSSLQSLNLDLTQAGQDTVVLRDGTVVMGDVTSVTVASVTVNVKGKPKRYDRNQVARVVFVQRQAAKKAARKGR